MFDKLVESNSAEAEFKPRRKFFMVSSVVVGLLFVTALMVSLYAQNLDLGTDNFDLSVIMTPVADAPEPEPVREQPRQSTAPKTDVPVRNQAIASMDTSPKIPDTISTTPNKYRAMPLGPVRIDPNAVESDGVGSSRPTGAPGSGLSELARPAETEVAVTIPPPPAIVKPEPKALPPQSKGVVNGFAIDLPKPPYSAAAKAINLTGSVSVQVLIDERGNVVSAKAVKGHMLFARDSEQAAKRAKFKPTMLGDQPVKVTGIIVYNFTRQ